MAAVIQIEAAVVRPRTEPRRTKISPAPMKPIPETICAATRDGSRTISLCSSTSVNPYLLTSMNSAAPMPTRAWVRRPASFWRISRSRPMAADSSAATPSSPIWSHPWPLSVFATGDIAKPGGNIPIC